ncbi:MAG TPA: TetR/AcrR family transcriptional regulator [Acidimicrobiales bacterium]|nr:TetR/AcrR family transcriptional regulator [Acidimicrobiales bacterium]
MLTIVNSIENGKGAPEVRARRYRSTLRAERAAETKRRIALAARELFAERGFAGTTVAGIAERAGVAVPTVYATYGSKGAIVRSLLAQLEEDADAAGWRARIAGEDDPRRKLAYFAQWSGAFFSLSRAVVVAARDAAGDPAIVELRDHGDAHRRQALRSLLESIRPALGPDLSAEAALDRAWILTGLELYLAAVEGCGWSGEGYVEWLTGLLHTQLLRPAPTAPLSTRTGRTGRPKPRSAGRA